MSVLNESHARRLLACVGVLTFLAVVPACSSIGLSAPSLDSVGSWVTPYKMDVIQGNFVSREQAAALVPGMPRAQVRDILGTPLIASAFHADRWDYVFTFRRQGQADQQRKLTVFFKNEVLERVQSDELPTEAEFVASIDAKKRVGKPPVLEAPDASLKEFEEKQRAESAASVAPPVAPISNYPPLEPAGSGSVR